MNTEAEDKSLNTYSDAKTNLAEQEFSHSLNIVRTSSSNERTEEWEQDDVCAVDISRQISSSAQTSTNSNTVSTNNPSQFDAFSSSDIQIVQLGVYPIYKESEINDIDMNLPSTASTMSSFNHTATSKYKVKKRNCGQKKTVKSLIMEKISLTAEFTSLDADYRKSETLMRQRSVLFIDNLVSQIQTKMGTSVETLPEQFYKDLAQKIHGLDEKITMALYGEPDTAKLAARIRNCCLLTIVKLRNFQKLCQTPFSSSTTNKIDTLIMNTDFITPNTGTLNFLRLIFQNAKDIFETTLIEDLQKCLFYICREFPTHFELRKERDFINLYAKCTRLNEKQFDFTFKRIQTTHSSDAKNNLLIHKTPKFCVVFVPNFEGAGLADRHEQLTREKRELVLQNLVTQLCVFLEPQVHPTPDAFKTLSLAILERNRFMELPKGSDKSLFCLLLEMYIDKIGPDQISNSSPLAIYLSGLTQPQDEFNHVGCSTAETQIHSSTSSTHKNMLESLPVDQKASTLHVTTKALDDLGYNEYVFRCKQKYAEKIKAQFYAIRLFMNLHPSFAAVKQSLPHLLVEKNALQHVKRMTKIDMLSKILDFVASKANGYLNILSNVYKGQEYTVLENEMLAIRNHSDQTVLLKVLYSLTLWMKEIIDVILVNYQVIDCFDTKIYVGQSR